MKLWCNICEKELSPSVLSCPQTTPTQVHVLEKMYNGSDLCSAAEYKKRFTTDKNAYRVFKEILSSWNIAKRIGAEEYWSATLETIDSRAGTLFKRMLETTPLADTHKLEEKLGFSKGCLVAKNETVNLTGSHKSRHHVGTVLYQKMLQKMQGEPSKACAVFSCGNSALGAGALAYSADVPLFAFVPEHVNPAIAESLVACGTTVVKVARDATVGQGDPCYNRFSEALSTFKWSALSCYAHDSWSSIEGAEVLALELCMQAGDLDSIVVQVGGAGLAHGVLKGLMLAKKLGLVSKMPKLFLVQTSKCYPMLISYISLLRKFVTASGEEVPNWLASDNYLRAHAHEGFAELEKNVSREIHSPFAKKVLREVAIHRKEFFKPWPFEVELSIAEGIMDDTTYDGFEALRGVLESGGSVEILSEQELQEAQNLAQEFVIPNVSATGTAGLAGLLKFVKKGLINKNERTAFLLTGVEERTPIPPSEKKGRIVTLTSRDQISSICTGK